MCYANWQGIGCDVPICLSGSDCQGSYVNPGEYICDEGRTGILCESMITTDPPTDSKTEESSVHSLMIPLQIHI